MLFDASGRATSTSQKELLTSTITEFIKAVEQAKWGGAVILMAHDLKHPNRTHFSFGISPSAAMKAPHLHDAAVQQFGTISSLIFPDVNQALQVAREKGLLAELQAAFKDELDLACVEVAKRFLRQHVDELPEEKTAEDRRKNALKEQLAQIPKTGGKAS